MLKFRAMLVIVVCSLVGCASGQIAEPVETAVEDGVFVHLFEWRWPDVARECEEVLGPAGFAAVQVSPAQEHIPGPQWWTRYQPVSYLIESRGGTRDEFAEMVRRCGAAGVDVYADAIINHMASVGSGTGVAGSTYSEYSYPVPYDYNDFHHCGRNENDSIANYQDLWEVQTCQLGSLPDLDTGSAAVQAKIATHLNDLLSLGVAGMRLDAAKHIQHDELAAILSRLDRDVLVYQEVIAPASEPIKAENYLMNGRIAEFDYISLIFDAFEQGNLAVLTDFWSGQNWLAGDKAIIFMDNHDLQRAHVGSGDVVNFRDGARFDLASVFMLAHPYGYPMIMSSYQFENDGQGPPAVSPLTAGGCGDVWVCEHRRDAVIRMVDFRRATAGSALEHWNIIDNAVISFGRGNTGHVIINTSEQPASVEVATRMPAGSYADVLADGRRIAVDDDGFIRTKVPPLSAVAIHN